MTQQQLAMAAGIAMSAVAQMEAGKIQDPRLSTLKALARALGVGLLDLAEDPENQQSSEPIIEAIPKQQARKPKK